MAIVIKPRIFLDTSALFAGIWSAEGGSRMLLKLGEAGAIALLVSSEVLAEAEAVVRRKAPNALGLLSLLLHQSQVGVIPSGEPRLAQQYEALTGHAGDAAIVAAAWGGRIDYFVTLDRRHLLGNAPLVAAVPFPIGTPGDCLAWYREPLAPG